MVGGRQRKMASSTVNELLANSLELENVKQTRSIIIKHEFIYKQNETMISEFFKKENKSLSFIFINRFT